MSATAQTYATSDDRSEPAVVHDSWSSGAPMPTALSGVATGVIKGMVYVVGGFNNSGVFNINQIYNPKKKTWKTGMPMPTARGVGASAVADNILYVIGGCGSGCGELSGALSVVEAYDPASDTWSTKSPLPEPTFGMYAVAVKGVIYVVGGYVPGMGQVATVYSYNPAADSWAQEASMNVGRDSPATAALGARIVASGGYGNSGFVSDNEIYSVAKNSWKTVTPDPTERVSPCFAGIAGQLYVAGGDGNPDPDPLTLVEAYSVKANSWVTLASMPQAVIFPGSAEVGGRLYCFGGSSTGSVFLGSIYDNVQIYQP